MLRNALGMQMEEEMRSMTTKEAAWQRGESGNGKIVLVEEHVEFRTPAYGGISLHNLHTQGALRWLVTQKLDQILTTGAPPKSMIIK